MASLNITQEELKAVEQTRQRLFQLSNSIGSLKADVYASKPLPNLESLQTSADILQLNMRSLVDVMSHNNELFSRLAIHPSTNFPGRTQENILLQLLRKKPEPDVASSMDEGRKMYHETAEAVGLTGDIVKKEGYKGGDDEDDPESMFGTQWGAARVFIGNRSEKYIKSGESEDPFTKEEREIGVENVRTGLRRVLEEYEDDDEEDDEDGGKKEQAPAKEEDDDDDIVMYDRAPPPRAAQPPPVQAGQSTGGGQEVEGLPLETILRMATKGKLV